MIWIAVIIIALIILFSITSFAARQNTQNTTDTFETWLSGQDINIDVEHMYNNPLLITARYIVDLNAKAIHVMSQRNDKIKAIRELREFSPNLTLQQAKDAIDMGYFNSISFNDINGFEILEDSTVTDGIGRAIAGGILAGGVGAIVGAVTAKKYVTSYSITFYTNNIAKPQIIIPLLNSKTKKDSMEYRQASHFAQQINASIKAIIANQEGNI